MDNNEVFRRGEFSGSLKKKPAPSSSSGSGNDNIDTNRLSRPLSLSSSTKKVNSHGTSSFNSIASTTTSSSSTASKLKKKKSISLSRDDKDKDKETDEVVTTIKIPKSKDETKEKQKLTKIIRSDDHISSGNGNGNGSRKSTSTISTTTTTSSQQPTTKDQIQDIKLKKKKRSKSVGGSSSPNLDDNEESETINKLKSSVSSTQKQKQLKRKSIDSGNIFQLDKQIEEVNKEDSNNNNNNNDDDENINVKSKKIKISSTKKLRHSIAGDSLSLKQQKSKDDTINYSDNDDVDYMDIEPTPKISSSKSIDSTKKKKKRASTLATVTSNSHTNDIQQQQQQQPKPQSIQLVHNVQFTQPQPSSFQYVNNNSSNNNNNTIYPKTPIPNKSGNKKLSSRVSTSSSTPYVSTSIRMTPMSVQSTNQPHFYPQSPGGFEYNYETPSLPMQPLQNNQNYYNNNNNLSVLSPSEKNISFDTEEQFENLDQSQQQQQQQYITKDIYQDKRNQSQLISEEDDEFILFKYLLLIVSFVFWFLTMYTLFGFLYHFNDVKYCDTNVSPRYDNSGKLDCQWCPDKGLCENGNFLGCQNDYVIRGGKNYIECILDPSKVQGLVTAINNIDSVLRDHKGKFECGTSPLISMEIDQLKKHFLSRYWLNKDQADQTFNTLIDYITSKKNIEELGIDRKLIKTFTSIQMEDGTYQLFSTDESIRPLWCQSYFFVKSLIMHYIHVLLVIVAGYLGFQYYKYQKHNQNEEILFVEQTFKKITRALQQRKQTYEEPWVSELILREEIQGPNFQNDKKLTKIWSKTMDLVYNNHRILNTPREILGESVSTLEWIDSNPTPKKVNHQQNFNTSNDSINYDDISIDGGN